MPSRRTVIAGTGTALTVALAGCIGDDDDDDDEVAEPPETDFSSQEIDTPEDPDEPRHVEISVTGGDSFASDEVFVRGEEIASDHDGAAWYELAVDFDDEEISAGDEVEVGGMIHVEVADDTMFRIDLEWEHDDHDEAFTIFRVLGEDAEDPDA